MLSDRDQFRFSAQCSLVQMVLPFVFPSFVVCPSSPPSKPQTLPFAKGRQGILQYPAFNGHFKYFVYDVLTGEATKLSILRSYIPQSVWEEIGESVLTHPDNYWLVLEELDSRYNRPHLVARAYIHELVSLPPVPVDHPPALLSFCRKVSAVMKTLTSIGKVADLKSTSTLT